MKATAPPLNWLDKADLGTAYDAQLIERDIYAWWEGHGMFKPRFDPHKKPFVISIPPPNVTGALHAGHGLTNAIEDLLIRWHRMLGDPTLWVPGTDHAGIATQAVVERLLAREGRTRQELGRDLFVENVWEWKDRYHARITEQSKRMGISADWERERFTLDEGLSFAVRTAFKRLYDDGMIYRGAYLVNWCPGCGTAISDEEVIYRDEPEQGSLWYLRYKIATGPDDTDWQIRDDNGSITIATTRPETLLGDTAVAVHPDDDRFRTLVGQYVLLPALGRRIPIIADPYVDREFGTGALKITPGHDPNDYEVGKRHRLPTINILNFDATINENGGPYAGLDRFEARQRIVADLEAAGNLAKVQPHLMKIGRCQRSDTIVEPLISTQWFCKSTALAPAALRAVREGRTKIVPERFDKIYTHWMENIRDWCISRQLWWGHRIPVWYGPDDTQFAALDETGARHQARAHYGRDVALRQDEDVLDTWFSSGLWPFSTLGWPQDTEDYRTFYPTSVLETGYDILFFWVAKMMMLGIYLTGREPFETVYLHGLVRDEQGRKMSKSLDNVLDPLDLMARYGTDAVRWTFITSSSPGQDFTLQPTRLEASRNFANKLWNIARFVIGKLDQTTEEEEHGPQNTEQANQANQAHREHRTQNTEQHARRGNLELETWNMKLGSENSKLETRNSKLTTADNWILSRYSRLCADVDRLMRSWNLGEAGRQIEAFLWDDFADWYIETAKVQLEDEDTQAGTRQTLYTVLDGTLRLLHPFMPFVTEAAWQHLHRGEEQRPAGLIVAPYPQADAAARNEAAERDYDLLREIVRGIRNTRNESNVEPARWIDALVVAGERANALAAQGATISRLARVAPERLVIERAIEAPPSDAAAFVVGGVEVYLPLAGMVNLDEERARLQKELERAETDAERRRGKLANASFVERAPATVVQKERDSLAASEATASKLRERLAALG